MISPVVVTDNLTKIFPGMDKPALDKISIEIFPGRMTGIVGPDGAGKTTLIRHLVALMNQTSGKVSVSSFDTQSQQEEIHRISGYMPQKFGLYEDLSVIENLELYSDLRFLDPAKKDQKFKQLLDFTGLADFTTRLAGKLSGGMKQKLGLACALIGEPKIVFLDEPSVGVDPISRRELWKMVRDLTNRGIAVVWSTSYLDEAEACDSVILLNHGKKLYDGPPKDLIKNLQGRTWHITGLKTSSRRSFLMEILKSPEVKDAVIQGKNIRVLSDKKTLIGIENAHHVKASFEDGFIDLLGGVSCRESTIANEIKAKPEDKNSVIDARNLTKKFGDFRAVDDVSFQIKRGEIFGLLGPNGAGKSTTFKMMCGLLRPTNGDALVKGLDLKTATSEARARIGYMAQKFSLYSNLNVMQNLKFFSGLYGLSGSEQKKQIDLMVDIFGLASHIKMDAGILPLGFKQRLALACSLMHQPDVLFLDEPTSGVDPITRREFWLHINGMVTKGITVMVTTHFMDEAEYCDRIALIYGGKNIAMGTPDYLKDLVRSTSIPEPTLEDAFVSLIESQKSDRR
ncbi:MAG: ABC transporter ATP-binding protein [Rickettsiaceae bacterium]|nr:ABC transporter ATP-binding protein [Rickettsiaceae bacterium]